jgi:hypothetical protein
MVTPIIDPNLPEFISEKIVLRGRKVGMFLGKRIGDEAFVTFSLCNLSKDKFDKERAIEIALDRCHKFNEKKEVPVSIKKKYKNFVERCFRYFKTCEINYYMKGLDEKPTNSPSEEEKL